MHDIRSIREKPAAFDHGLARRGLPPAADAILADDAALRAVVTELQSLEARRNEASKAIGAAKARGDAAAAAALMAEVATNKQRISALEEQQRARAAALEERLASLPNLPAAEVPDGADESANRFVRAWGAKPAFNFAPREHDEIGARLGLDFEGGARVSGARFTVMRGAVARLHRALAQMMLDTQSLEHGFEETAVPYLVRDAAMYGTGQLPKFAGDSFRTENGYWLIPTSEVSLTNLASGQIIARETLPWRMSALTPCFRSEAGAAGRDTRGMIRQHQFDKVEMVAITTAEDSEAMHEQMVANAERVLQKLGLHYRVMLLSAGDMGASARKTYDLEVWLPGQGQYREISSVSNCGDYQARRMNARTRANGDKGTEFVHTLNGSGVAVGRALVAVLENGQQADGSVTVPPVLRPYMNGIEVLRP
jgi:seryl-tRNA synthetase